MSYMSLKAVFAVTAVAAGSALAMPGCIPRDEAMHILTERLGERRHVAGLDARGVIEFFGSEKTGHWTLTLTRPDGTTCRIAQGHAFLSEPGNPPGVGRES